MNEPQRYLNIQYSWNNPNLECFYLVTQVGSTNMNDIFGLTGNFVAWDSKLTSSQKTIWLHKGAKNLEIMTWIQDLPHSR